ncbi:hypothetical protein AGOR_G00150520 [Albula goreensis]|uniref:KN motif and ankyrin repeat domain-containing protein 4 n=1 Tax=Albula goreensis TaxID=1534307 RepID=A0A8T3D3A3_9TELE|nr:hypothetical protein AGOR_G00150520 [Albula goreensis]
MMDKKNANGFSSKASESGSQRKQLPYSVETPYGFHLDLDFLKYVDDIEKGNTIKRVHIQRRNKGPKFSTLPRNFSLPGHGSRTAPKDSWASTSTLGPKPKSRVMEVQQIFEFRACESGSLGHPRVPGVIQKSTREDVGVRVFDEQPLGVHVRPHLLRASSMPVTVLQRKNSESVEDKGAQATGNSCRENGSSENVFATSEVADLHQQVATALQRIRELEEQVRTIPELQAEICSLREEKEQLLLKLKSQTPVLTEDSVEPTEQKDNEQISSVSENLTIKMLQEKLMALEEKFSDANRELEKTNTLLREQMEENKLKEERIKQLTEEAEDFEKAEKEQVCQDTGALEETKQKETSDLALSCDVSVSTDLAPKTLSKGVSTDEELLLPDTAPIAGEQQKHLVHSGTQTDLTDAQEVSTDVVTVEQFQEVEITVHTQVVETALQKESSTAIQEEPAGTAGEAEGSVAAADSQLTASDGAEEAGPSAELQQPSQSDQDREPERQGPSEPATSNVAIGQYVNKIHGLLNEQWACLGSGHPEIATTLKQPASKFSSIQTQLVSSLNALSAFYSSPGQKGGASRQAGLKSIMKKNDPADKPGNGGAKKNLKFVGVNGGYETTSSEESSGEDNADEDNAEEDSSEPEVEGKDEGPGLGTEAAAEDVTEEPTPEGAEAAAPLPEGDTAAPDTMDPDASASPQEEQPGREPVHEGFMAACHYIKDRQAEVATPDKEMREFLTVLYQEWFRVSSQKDSLVDTVTLYLKEVGAATPTLLRFIVNLADGNGNSALHYSVSHSNFPIVKLLLDTGLCEVDNQNKAGYTAVMLASLTAADGPEDMEVALQLLRQGNVNARASQAGQTALMLAVSHGRSAMVRLLLTCEADVNMQDHDGSTALMCACEHGHTDIARLLLERDDCDLSLTDREGHDALAVATQASHSEMVDLLKAHTGDGASAAPKPL